jgi:hypothetical protein
MPLWTAGRKLITPFLRNTPARDTPLYCGEKSVPFLRNAMARGEPLYCGE